MSEHTPAIAFDLESHLIAPGLLSPPPVCGSAAWVDPGNERLIARSDLYEFVQEHVVGSELVVGANIAFDFGILVAYGYMTLEQVFAAYEEGRVYDVQIAQALDAIAGGHLFKDPQTLGALYVNGKHTKRYSLEACVKLCLGRDDAKGNDEWRLKYALLDGVPLEAWPAAAKQYPLDDARNTMDCALVQLGHLPRPGEVDPRAYANLHNMKEQAYAAWCLHLSSMWGIRTDAKAVEALRLKVAAKEKDTLERFTGIFIRGPEAKSKVGTEDQATLKRAVAKAYGALGECPVCGGSGKVTSASSGNPINCKDGAEYADWHPKGKDRDAVKVFRESLKAGRLPAAVVSGGCDGTGLDLSTAPGLPRTEKGAISTNRDILMESGDDTLESYGVAGLGEKLGTTYLPFVEKGIEFPINVRSNVIVETGRTSYDDVVQLMPKEGGVRETICAPEGWVISSVDYAAVELCTLAQAHIDLFGHSTMADLINETKDPGSLHTAMAARMVGASFEEMKARVKAGDKQAGDYRQGAKAAKFGYPGGMGAATLVLAKRKLSEGFTACEHGPITNDSGVRGYAGIRFCILMVGAERCGVEKVTEWKGRPIAPTCVRCLECATDLREVWFAEDPEMKPYFDYVSRLVDSGAPVEQLRSGRLRGGANFTAAANGFFQGLAADGAKEALARVSKEMYLGRQSPLYGSRILLFAHDEIVAMHPEGVAHEAAMRLVKVMEEAMRAYVPDVFIKAEPALMRNYSKSAKDAYDANGRLIPWEDRQRAKAA